jgi:Rhodopirellula transposase DDE domain
VVMPDIAPGSFAERRAPVAAYQWLALDHDTSAFAVAAIRQWCGMMGRAAYPTAHHLLITADAGGSNGYHTRAWKTELQRLADDLQLRITVCHFPPGTSTWNKIEHRRFCHITTNWRGRALRTFETIVDLMGGAVWAWIASSGLRLTIARPTGGTVIGDGLVCGIRLDWTVAMAGSRLTRDRQAHPAEYRVGRCRLGDSSRRW